MKCKWINYYIHLKTVPIEAVHLKTVPIEAVPAEKTAEKNTELDDIKNNVYVFMENTNKKYKYTSFIFCFYGSRIPTRIELLFRISCDMRGDKFPKKRVWEFSRDVSFNMLCIVVHPGIVTVPT